MGPHHQIKSRGPCHPHQPKHMPVAGQVRRTTEIHQRTYKARNHLTLQKPLCRCILFHQKEEWKATTYPGLPTSQQMDDQEPLPLTTNSSANQLTPRVYAIHKIRHQVGLQQCLDQGWRSVESGIHNQ